jgi:transposase
MVMKRFVKGVSRDQSTLFPEKLDDFIAEDNPVRVIDAFVEALDLRALGFKGVDPSATGRPAYHPAVLLKLYVYGYLNRIPSSRRLEREAQRNVELMWLIERLAPDFKTIADFRRDNGKAIVNVCREFVAVCRRLELFAEGVVAIDGSKFKAVNNGDRNFTPRRLQQRKERIEQHINRYLSALATADRQGAEVPAAKTSDLKEKLARLKVEMKRLEVIETALEQTPDKQLSLTDPDARVMATRHRNSGVVGYNVQSAVDTKHHLIVTHEVTNAVTDRNQLANMARQTRDAIETDKLTVVADRGYFSGVEVRACQAEGIRPLVPKPHTSSNRLRGRFTKDDFRYDADNDQYLCPAGETLTWRFQTVEAGLNTDIYFSSACKQCAIKARCTITNYRRIHRWEHAADVESMLDDLDRHPDTMALRKQTAEHPFGTIKTWMGATHFLTRTLAHVRTEMSLHVLAYNMKRVMNLIGVTPLIEAVRA